MSFNVSSSPTTEFIKELHIEFHVEFCSLTAAVVDVGVSATHARLCLALSLWYGEFVSAAEESAASAGCVYKYVFLLWMCTVESNIISSVMFNLGIQSSYLAAPAAVEPCPYRHPFFLHSAPEQTPGRDVVYICTYMCIYAHAGVHMFFSVHMSARRPRRLRPLPPCRCPRVPRNGRPAPGQHGAQGVAAGDHFIFCI